MKLKPLVPLMEKKEAIASSPTTNLTLHFEKDFQAVGEEGTPEATFAISISSTGGKEFYRDSDLWWIIASANPQVKKDTLFIEPGLQLRIPSQAGVAEELFRKENRER